MLKKLVFFLCLITVPCLAADKPPEINSTIHASVPYGTGEFQKLFVKVYDADLWTDAPKWTWDAPFALALHYHIGIDGKEMSEKSVELIQDQQPLTDKEIQGYGTQLDKVFPSVKDGDEITALYHPKNGLSFYFNGAPTGTIHDLVFAKRLLSIWFSEKTASPELRRELLSLPPSP